MAQWGTTWLSRQKELQFVKYKFTVCKSIHITLLSSKNNNLQLLILGIKTVTNKTELGKQSGNYAISFQSSSSDTSGFESMCTLSTEKFDEILDAKYDSMVMRIANGGETLKGKQKVLEVSIKSRYSFIILPFLSGRTRMLWCWLGNIIWRKEKHNIVWETLSQLDYNQHQ